MSAKQKKVILPVLIVVGLSLGAFAFASGRKAARRNAESGAGNPLQMRSVALGPAQMVRFTLYDAGIFPREARVSAGQVVIYLEDVSGNSAGLVVIESTSRLTLGQVIRSQGQGRGSSRLAMVPGSYEVFDASRPGNRARLIVEP